MDGDFLHLLAAKLLSETGLVGGLLLAACLWLARQWSNERKEHRETINKVFEMSEKKQEAALATATALQGLQGMVERLTYERRQS